MEKKAEDPNRPSEQRTADYDDEDQQETRL